MLPADNWVILLLVLGCLLMLAELILPTAGILGAAGIIILVVGVVIAFVNGGLSQG
jgi:membrane-bound ClpP family serine protease